MNDYVVHEIWGQLAKQKPRRSTIESVTDNTIACSYELLLAMTSKSSMKQLCCIDKMIECSQSVVTPVVIVRSLIINGKSNKT